MSTVCNTFTSTNPTASTTLARAARQRAAPILASYPGWRLDRPLDTRYTARAGSNLPILRVFTSQLSGARAERPTEHIRARWRAAPYQAIPTAADDDSSATHLAAHFTRPAFAR